MNSSKVLDIAARTQAAGQACALVTVLRAESPTAARPGDKAVVMADGTIKGWVGGGCAQPAVVKTVRAALDDGRPRIIRIAPSDQGERDLADVLEFGMACHSGGTLELFIDPLLPMPQLVVIGTSPVAVALSRLAPHVGFEVVVAARGAEPSDFLDAGTVLQDDGAETLRSTVRRGAYVVVATQGRRDLAGLKAALSVEAAQVSFVASARKADVLRESLVGAGFEPRAVADIVAPAGYPIQAGTPEEIALSVLAAVVAERRGRLADTSAGAAAPAVRAAQAAPAAIAKNSCCGTGPEPVTAVEREPVSAGHKAGSCCGS